MAYATIVVALLTPVLGAPPSEAAGNTYYVAMGGSDSNPGSVDRPWRTIQKAANTMGAGDVCVALGGAYGERVRVSKSGSAGAPITFRADGVVTLKGFTIEANYITVRGFDITETPNDNTDGFGIFLTGSYCVIEGNYIHYCTRGGISMYVEPHDSAAVSDCIIRNNRFYKNAMFGIEVHGRNHLIEGNEVCGTIQHHPKWTNAPSYVDADGMRFFGAGHTFRGNYIHDISYSDPENVSPHIDGFQTWGPAHDITFERNIIDLRVYQTEPAVGQGFMVEESPGAVFNMTIRNNIIRAFRSNFIACENLQLLHNVFESFLSAPIQGYYPIILHSSPGAMVENNIFYNVGDGARCLYADGTSPQGLVMDYNCVYRSDGKAPKGSASPHDLWNLDPRFVNPSAGDFHVQSGSLCIDAGTLLAQVTSDMDGTSRPQGSTHDIGAYEFHSEESAPATMIPTIVPTQTPTRTVTPVPITPTVNPSELIIDNTDNGFAVQSSQDAWTEYIEAGGQHFGGSHYYNHLLGTGQDTASWSFTLPRPGKYEVYAWWWAGDWRPSNVPYTVKHSAGSTTVRVNQQTNGAQWNLLGAFDFQASGSVTVSDDATPGQDVAADAIRLVYVGIAPTPSPTPAGAETTLILQQGNGGYAGAQDTHMEQYSASTNFSGQDAFRVGYKQTLAGLLQFDLSSVPPGVSISSARLQVYATGWGGVNIGMGAYALLRTAELAQATWNQASTGQAWGLSGCNDTNTDRRGTPESIVTTNGINQWYSFDVTALVQQWVNGEFANNGLLLRQTTTAAYRFLFASAEKGDVALRPKLVVNYRGGAAPTPSATPTSTTPAIATPTATRVASATPTATTPATAMPTATTVASATPTATTPATATPTATTVASATPTATTPATATPTATASASATRTATATLVASTATATATATPTAYGASTTVTLRQGDSGYTGAQDAWISADAPTTNYGAGDLLKVGYRQKYAPLLHFDLSSIPAGSTVVEAKLQVWATGWSGANLTIAAHAVLRHAASSQVTWSQASAGNPWGLPGCDDVVTDRRLNAESTLTTAGIRKWYAFDVTSLVQEWISSSLANEGVLLRQSIRSDGSMWLASAENPISDNRPKLVVTYR